MIKIRVVLLLLLCWVLSGTACGYPLTIEQKLDELEYLLQMIEENYPFLWSNERVLGLDWLGKKEEFRGMVAATADDAQYYQAISRLLSTLQNAHTHLISPQSLPLFVRDYRNTQPWAGTMTEEVHQAYQYWQKIIGESSIVPPFYARYIAGEYMVVASSNEALPIGALLLEVDGQPVHEYVSGCYDRVELRLDPLRNQMYAPYMPIPSIATIELTFKFDDRILQVVLDTASSHPSSPGRQQDNVTCDILEADRIAYLRIRSFRREYEQVDEPVIRDFLTSVRHYPNLIIDIRGNSGGTVSYWQKLLVAPLIHRTVAADVFLTIRSGQYVQDFLKARIGLGYHFLKVNRGSLAGSLDLPCEMLTERFIEPIKLPTIVRPRQPEGFFGRIFLLVDDLVYSSAEAFALFARQTDWATLVGTRTGGDGVGIDPVVFSLPHSGLLVRMAQSLGLNPDGSVNNESGTQPHYYVELAADEYATYASLAQEGNLTGTYPALDRILRCAMELADTTSVVPQALHNFGRWMKDLGQDMFTPPMGLSSLYQEADFSVYDGYSINLDQAS